MHLLGIIISLCSFFTCGILVLRGVINKSFIQFPLFYSYVTYAFCAAILISLINRLDPALYSGLCWFNFLINALAEFAVLVEISDHIFRPFILIRNLGRALTILITASFGLLYILPTILGSKGRGSALAKFALRTSVTKAIILVVLFYLAKHYDSRLGKNVGGLMLGFSIYMAMNVTIWANHEALSATQFAPFIWVMLPLASALCMVIWAVCLWQTEPAVNVQPVSASGNDSPAVALELARFNSELSKILHK